MNNHRARLVIPFSSSSYFFPFQMNNHCPLKSTFLHILPDDQPMVNHIDQASDPTGTSTTTLLMVSAMLAALCAFDDLSVTFDDLCVSGFLKPQETVPLTLTLGSYHLLSYRTYDDDDFEDNDGDDDDDGGNDSDDGDDGIFGN